MKDKWAKNTQVPVESNYTVREIRVAIWERNSAYLKCHQFVIVKLPLRQAKHHALMTKWKWTYSSIYSLIRHCIKGVSNCTLRLVYRRRKSSRCLVCRRLVGPKIWAARFGEEENLSRMLAIQPRFLGCSISMTTELFRIMKDQKDTAKRKDNN